MLAIVFASVPRGGTGSALDPLEATFWTAAGGTLVVGWLAVALGSAGAFSLRSVGAGCLLVALGIAVVLARGGPRTVPPRRCGRRDLAAGVLVLVCGAAWARPHEYVLGGADAGTYVNVAAHLARTGSLVASDP